MSRRACTECGGVGNREGIECERCDGSCVEPRLPAGVTMAQARGVFIHEAEQAGRRGDMAGRVAALAALVPLIPTPPPPVLPPMPVDRRRAARIAAAGGAS